MVEAPRLEVGGVDSAIATVDKKFRIRLGLNQEGWGHAVLVAMRRLGGVVRGSVTPDSFHSTCIELRV